MSESPTPEKSVSEEIAELRAMPVTELVVRYEALHGRPPRSKNRVWLWKRCAWRVQEQSFGGLSEVARRRLDELIGELDLPLGQNRTVRSTMPAARKAGAPPVGTTLVREWKGREVRATRTDEGWECDGVVHRSLSGVVTALTGSHASGPAWFGLAGRKRKAARGAAK